VDHGPRQPQRLDRGRIGRRLQQHRVARLHEDANEQVEALLRARRHQQLLRGARDAALTGQALQFLPQRSVALRRAVLERPRRAGQGAGRGLAQALGVEQACRRIAARERNHSRPAQVREQFADRRACRIGEGRAEEILDHRGTLARCDRPRPCAPATHRSFAGRIETARRRLPFSGDTRRLANDIPVLYHSAKE